MTTSALLVVYSSGHGFGHAARDIQVLAALHALRPDMRLHLRTQVAEWFLRHSLDGIPCERSAAVLDVGIVQPDGVHQDVDVTLQECRRLLDRRAELVAREAQFLREIGAGIVLSDIAALPLAAAQEVGIPAVALSNFTWDWIYGPFTADEPGFLEVCLSFSHDYNRAERVLRLPFHGGDEAFAAFRAVEDVPMVARKASLSVEETRRRLGLPGGPVVLVSFGGLGPASFDWAALEQMHEYLLVLTPPLPANAPTRSHDNLLLLDNDTLRAAGVAYPDLVAACDVVVTKPGYGITSECLANETRVLYTSRGDFAEYPFLVAGLEQFGVASFIPHQELFSGQWRPYLEPLLQRPRRACPLPTNGAEVVARRLLEMLR